MLIATAGHIDHGKTALVRALTGTDTDRLPEEKGRGISIDLGFAYWQPENAPLIGFVDVPGHERYVRNMLAGLCGVDFALLVVAADDGVMPQTTEHLAMLDLMGIRRGQVAMTKCDKADPARQQEVRAQIARLLAPTGLAGAPIHAVSSLTGEGVASLAKALSEAARDRPDDASGAARFVIDRCFTISGAGTVVTGTVLSGTLTRGDHVVLSPQGTPLRIRGLQSVGQTVDSAGSGERCAVNLAGIEVSQLHRGDWLLDPALHAPTSRIAARIEVTAPLRHGSTVRLYIGAAEVPARMLSRRQEPVSPGESRVVALALERPAVALNGARLVLRDGSGRALIGGGRVVDPFAPPRFRRDDGRDGLVAALELHDAPASLAALLACQGEGIECAWFENSFGLRPQDARALYAQAGAEVLGKAKPMLLSAERIAALGEAVLALLASHHSQQPEAGGMTLREIARGLDTLLPGEVLGAILRGLADRGALEFSGPLLRLCGHRPGFGGTEVSHWLTLQEWLEEGPPRTVTPAEASAELRISESSARALLMRRRLAGDLWEVSEGRFMIPDHVAKLAAAAYCLAERHPQGFTAAQFRDATALGRNHVIRLLEFFDRIGATRRSGEIRVMRPGWADVLGMAEPWLAGETPRLPTNSAP